ncbi:MAG: endonuclease/exonuclease/phosphatase family protein [Planctomycetes bacterium]|nr:endonuclease/exonuclease/phosphatase family protein [Planctomycetota bacterium]
MRTTRPGLPATVPRIVRTPKLLVLALLTACAGAPASGERLVVATWNIHHGRGLDGVVDVDRIADVLRATGADVIALQEVDVGVARSGRIDVAGEIAARLGMTAVFGKNIDYQGGDYGNALLTRLPVESSENHHYAMLREGEQRGLLVVRLRSSLGPLVAMVTHVDHRSDDSERLTCVAELCELARRESAHAAVLAMGDFNDLPDSRVHARVLEDFADAWLLAGDGGGSTYPAGGPQKRIDWVLVHDDAALTPVRCAVPASAASDHLPVVVELGRHGGA